MSAMMKRLLGLAAICAIAAPGLAQADDLHSDLRCVILMNVLAQQKDQPQAAAFAGEATIYYVGRIDGRGMGAQLKDLLAAEAKTLNKAIAQSEADRCALGFKQRGEQMRAMAATNQAPASPAPKAAAPPPKK
jgi:hypothetical protein